MLFLAAASLTVSCSREKSGFGIEDPTSGIQDGKAMAYIDFSDSITVHEEGEVVITRGNNPTVRTAISDVNDFQVEIYSQEGDSVAYKSTYGAIQALDKQMIALTIGKYKIRVYSAEMKPAAWESDENQPTYGTETDYFELKVENDEANPYKPDEGSLVCKLQSIQVSVSLEEEMNGRCENTTVEVTLEDNSVTDRTVTFNDENADGKEDYVFGVVDLDEDYQVTGKPKRESKNAYLAPIDEENYLVARFKTTIDGKPIDKRVPITAEAKAGQWHKVSFYLKSSPEDPSGNIVIGVTVETWVYNELVEVKSLDGSELEEEVIPDINDPNAPIIFPRDGSFLLNDTNHITASDYTLEGDYNKNAIIDVTTKSNITRFAVRLRTDNASFMNYLRTNNLYNKAIDMMSTAPEEMNARNQLHTWGFPRAASLKDGMQHAIDLKSFMTYLAPYSGNHELTISVTDEQGLRSLINIDIALNLTGGSSSQPSEDGNITITWQDKDIDQRYEVYDGLECKITVDCPKGIKEFMVEISGAIGSFLPSAFIPNRFSLIEPEKYPQPEGAQATLKESLEGMGFPTGDEVKGQTHTEFDISNFMGALLITGKGDSDFRLTVTDNDGKEVSKTIMLSVKSN